MKKVFEAFNVNQKNAVGLRNEDFENRNVAIMVPTFDESHRLIEKEDSALYFTQRDDASILLEYIETNQKRGHVQILNDGDVANETNEKFDHVVFLHEFIESEQQYVLDGLRENNTSLTFTELY